MPIMTNLIMSRSLTQKLLTIGTEDALPPAIALDARLRMLPQNLRLTVLDGHRSQPVVGLIVRIVARITARVTYSSGSGEAERSLEWDEPLAALCTNHVGYVSFSLANIRSLGLRFNRYAAQLARRDGVQIERARLDIISLQLEAPAHLSIAVELLPEVLPLRFDEAPAHSAFGEEEPRVVPVVVSASDGPLADRRPTLPSIEVPDVFDWRLSPASFGMVHLPVIGADGCERMLPSHETDRSFRFTQILRRPVLEELRLRAADGEAPQELRCRPAKLVEYETTWRPLNHALGRLLYSLTLAPCESAKIATVDWRRSDDALRNEATRQGDDLVHAQSRDRVVDEVLEASIAEWQSGESFMGGTAGTGGYGSQGNGSMWGITGSHGIGYATATTAGDRDVEATTVQRLADSIAQSSRMVRDLRSTVVVQATQAEAESVQTRSVRNHNHSHALTVLYYEVVQHYLVETRAVRERNVLFIKSSPVEMTVNVLRDNERVLRANLLDAALADDFDALHATFDERFTLMNLVAQGEIRTILVRVVMGQVQGEGGSPWEKQMFVSRMRLLVMRHDGTIDHVPFDAGSTSHSGVDEPFYESNETITNTTTVRFENPFARLKVGHIREIGLAFNADGLTQPHRVQFRSVQVCAAVADGDSSRVVDLLSAAEVHDWHYDSEWWRRPNEVPTFDDIRETQTRIRRLVRHFEQNQAHYNRVLALHQDAGTRHQHFERFLYPREQPAGRLSDYVDNVPLGQQADWMIFALGPYARIDETAAAEDARVISLPTRGSFAEVELSHCNASEIIDNTRFWDWQTSPCTDEAPDIGGVTTGSRYQSALAATPSTLPSSGVGIRDAAEAPAPSGLAALLEQATKADIFRDMSGRAELATLLGKLVDAAAQVETARIEGLTKLGEAEAETDRAEIQTRRQPPDDSSRTSTPPQPSPTVNEPSEVEVVDQTQDDEEPIDVEEPQLDVEPNPPNTGGPGPSRSRRITIEVLDHRGRPVPGDYEFKVQRADTGEYESAHVSNHSHGFVSLWPRYSSGNVRIEVWASRLQLASYRTEHVRGLINGHLAQLPEEWVRARVSGASSFTLDPENGSSYLFRAVLAHSVVRVEFELHGDIHGRIRREVGASGGVGIKGLGEVTISGENEIEVEGGVGGSTTVQAEVLIALNHFAVHQGSDSTG